MKGNKWVQYEQQKQALREAIRQGKVPQAEYAERIRRIAAKLGV